MILKHLMKALRHRSERRLFFKTQHTALPEQLHLVAVFALTIDGEDTGFQFGDCVIVTDPVWWDEHRESVLSKHVVLYDGNDPEDETLKFPEKVEGEA